MRSIAVIFTFAAVSIALGQERPAPRSAPIPPATAAATAATDLWRRVLAMNAEQREEFIQSKPASAQVYLRSKVREYLALSPAEQEARLAALELRSMMLSLMKLSAPVRAQQLQALSAVKRKEVERRLLTWDILPPPLQKDVLENETVVRLFIESRQSGASREQLLADMPPQRRQEVEKKLEAWDSMTGEKQDQVFASVERFFELDEKTRSRTLGELSDRDRARLMPTLSAFDRMPKEQRDRALEGFRRFKQLSAAEQQEFVRTAQRWEAMKESDKRLWRQIVISLRSAPMPPPPTPPARTSKVSAAGQ
jgi:hypothetical protein